MWWAELLNTIVGVISTSPPALIVTGGTLFSDASFYYRLFTSSGTLGISNGTLTADVLVIAGGGGGGDEYGGGAGGAGLIGQILVYVK
jgi:hypothetical protein